MQPLSENLSSTNSESESSSNAGHNFMGVLAGLTSAKSSVSNASAPNPAFPAASATLGGSEWNDDALEDDVTTLSYESALRNIGRYKPTDASALNLPKDFDLASAAGTLFEKLSTEKAKAAPEQASANQASAKQTSAMNSELRPASAPLPARAAQQTPPASSPLPSLAELRKRASVTIRLSEPEYEQLHKRAAEAGLTISAYLRSCTFEAEALRAQVKEALASLRADAKREMPATQTTHRGSWRERLARIRRSGITINV